jgi:hypothetical protein
VEPSYRHKKSSLTLGQVMAEVLSSLKRTSGLRWLRWRCQVEEDAVTARAYETTRGVKVGEVGRGRV